MTDKQVRENECFPTKKPTRSGNPAIKGTSPQIGSFAYPSLRWGLPFTDHDAIVGHTSTKSMNYANAKRSGALDMSTGFGA